MILKKTDDVDFKKEDHHIRSGFKHVKTQIELEISIGKTMNCKRDLNT